MALPNIVPNSPNSGQTIGSKDKHWSAVYAEKLSGLEWKSSTQYEENDIVINNGKICLCKTANNDTIFDENNWIVLGNSSRVQSWKSAESYEPFQLLENNESLYMVVKSHTSTTIEADETNKNIKRIDTDLTAIGGANTTAQVTKLGVVAPKSVTIPIEKTELFNLSPIGVLKFKSGSTGVVSTVNDFSNADATDFEPNNFVEFNGKMKLKTKYEVAFEDETTVTDGTTILYVKQAREYINPSEYLSIKEINL